MITNAGKEIISKYMLGQVSGFATHLSLGCGAMPLKSNEEMQSLDVLLAKESLDFEMVRVPITSKGFVDNSKQFSIAGQQVVGGVVTLTTNFANDVVVGETVVVIGSDQQLDGTHTVTGANSATSSFSYITPAPNAEFFGGTVKVSRTSLSLTAEVPADNRYEITEIGIWSAENNSMAGTYDSHNVFNFTNTWQEHSTAISSPPTISNFGSGTDINQGVVSQKVFYASTGSEIFQNTIRKNRKEGPRFLNTTLMVRGDTCQISGLAGQWTPTGVLPGETPTHVHLNNVNFDISRNSPSDKLNFAFSLVDKDAVGNNNPDYVKVSVEFFVSEMEASSGYARLELYFDGNEFEANRYKNVSIPISQSTNSASSINSTISAVSGNGSLLTFTTYQSHRYEIGNEVTTSGAGLPLEYRVTSSPIVQKTTNSFTVESPATGSATSLSNSNAESFSNYRFITTPDFSSQNVRVCRIFASVVSGGIPSNSHYLAFDGMRIENLTTQNPIYKMTGYSVVKNPNGYPIVKAQNTNSFVEFRFNLGVS